MSSGVRDKPIGLILAGGQSERMGGVDKALALYRGRRLVDHVVERLVPQTSTIMISGRTDYGFGFPVVFDLPGEQVGPAAGLLSACTWLSENAPDCRSFVTVPVDAPLLPLDFVERLSTNDGTSVARTHTGLHPTFARWQVDRLQSVFQDPHVQAGIALYALAKECGALMVDFDDEIGFSNINTSDDLLECEKLTKQ